MDNHVRQVVFECLESLEKLRNELAVIGEAVEGVVGGFSVPTASGFQSIFFRFTDEINAVMDDLETLRK
jgi:hypothetical protein